MGWYPCPDCCGGSPTCPTQCINNATLLLSGYTIADATSAVLDDNVNFGTLQIPIYNAGVHDANPFISPWILSDSTVTSGCLYGNKRYDNPAAGTNPAPGAICGGLWATTNDCNGDVIPRVCQVPMDYSLWRIGVHKTDGIYIGVRMWPVWYNSTVADYVPPTHPNCTLPACFYESVEYVFLAPYTGSVAYSDVITGTALPFSNLGGHLAVGTNSQYTCSSDSLKYPIYNLTGSVTLGESYVTSPEIFCNLIGNEGEYWTVTGHTSSNTSCGELWGRATVSGSIYTLQLFKDPGRAAGDAVCGWSGPSPASPVTLTQLNSSGLSATCDYFPPAGLPIDFNFRILT